MRTALIGIVAAVMLSGCTVLTAPAPLFTPGDQDGVFALEEGLWAYRDKDCATDPARSSPRRKSCLDWGRIVRAADGSWRAEPATKEDADDAPVRFLVMPAMAAEAGLRAPVYVAEGISDKDPGPSYAALVPRGERSGPVRRLVLIALDCGAITRDGDIPDITVRRSDGRIVGCTATTKDAVREAARRGVLAEAGRIGDEELVWVRK